MRWSDWLHARLGRTDSIALVTLMERFFEFLTTELKRDPRAVAEALWRDYQRGGRRDKPPFLRALLGDGEGGAPARPRQERLAPRRQARHLV
jgi:hypothetical protein